MLSFAHAAGTITRPESRLLSGNRRVAIVARKIVLETAAGVTPILTERAADDELQLQELVKNNPDLISLDEFGVVGPLLVVGRETWLASGAVDLVAISKAGDLLVIEFKTGPANTDFRRALAQLLDYGSHLWGQDVESFEQSVAARYFSSNACQQLEFRGLTSLDLAARKRWSGISEQELQAFRDRLARQLDQGSFTYLLVAQRLTDQVIRGIEYLNHTMADARFYGVEIIRFTGDGYSAFETRTVVGPRTGSSGSGSASYTNEQRFLEEVADEEYRGALERLLDAVRGLGFSIAWGAVGCSIRIRTPDRVEPLSVAWLFPPGRSGWMGLSDITLGYDPWSARQTPSVQETLDWYVERVRSLPATVATNKGQVQAAQLSPSAVVTNASEIVAILGELAKRIASPADGAGGEG